MRKQILAISLIICALFSGPTRATADSADLISQSFVEVDRPDGSIDVSGDDTEDAYRGTGGLLLPSSYSGNGSSRKTIATCLGCVWRYTVYCQQGAKVFCAHAVTTCPRGQVRYRVWFGKTRQTTKVVGTTCWGVGKPATRRDIETQVNSSSLRYVPALNPGLAPSGNTLTSVPILVWSGQPEIFTPQPMNLAGHRVQIRATAMWRWIWGDGTAQWTSIAGGRYPKRAVSHKFLRAGRYQIQVQTVWRASYLVPGVGTFAATGDPIQQSAQLPITVRVGRAVLVAR